MTHTNPTRRRLLGSLAAGAVLLSGCSGNGGSDGSGDQGSGDGSSAEDVGTEDSGPGETSADTGTPSVEAIPLETTGDSVTILEARIDEAGWLVVHPAGDGAPDWSTVLGHRHLEPGEHEIISLELEEELEETQLLYAALYYDDPADVEFTPSDDQDPPVTVDGEPVVTSFEAEVF